MNKFYAVILAGCMMSSVVFPSAAAAASGASATPSLISRVCSSVTGTVSTGACYVTTPVRNNPKISAAVALVAVAAIAYYLLNAQDDNEEEEAQF